MSLLSLQLHVKLELYTAHLPSEQIRSDSLVTKHAIAIEVQCLLMMTTYHISASRFSQTLSECFYSLLQGSMIEHTQPHYRKMCALNKIVYGVVMMAN